MKKLNWFRMGALPIALMLCMSLTVMAQGKSAVVEVWMHHGEPAERAAMTETIKRFNAAHENIQAKVTYVVTAEYETKVATAAIAGKLPDLMDVDGPWVATWAWRGFLRPIGKYFTEDELNDFVPSIVIQGTWQGKLWALGQFESGLGLYFRKDILEEAGVTPPRKAENAWTWDEFIDVCKKVMATGKVERALDVRWEWNAEWWTYGFCPLMWSNGGALISPDGLKADGYINGPPSVEAMEALQKIFATGYASPTALPDQFELGKAAMSWLGHWMFSGYKKIYGDNLGLTFLPGIRKSATGSGSYTWGMTTQAENPEAVAKVLKWILEPESILMMTRGTDFEGNRIVAGNAAPPSRVSVYDHFPEYTEYPLSIFMTQLKKGIAHPRPVTPAYAAITREIQTAINDIALGSDVKEALDIAAEAIDKEIEENDYYGLK